MRTRIPPIRRDGFTLIELLVVIAIIGVLAALSIAGVSKIVESQRRGNSESAMRTVERVLNAHWKHVYEEAKKEELNLAGNPNLANLADGDQARARAIWIKLRLQEAFPLSYGEILNRSAYIPAQRRKFTSVYTNALNGRTAANDAATESAACLLIALSTSRGGTTLQLDSLTANVVDTDGDGLKELVDGWGKAMTFFRFPTGDASLFIANPNPNNPKCDPADTDGKLVLWTNGAKRSQVETMFGFQISASPNQFPAKYHAPTLVSAGPDGLLGLTGVMGIGNANQVSDNIYSFKLR